MLSTLPFPILEREKGSLLGIVPSRDTLYLPPSLRQCDTYCAIYYGHFEITPSNLIGSRQGNLFAYHATFFPANDNETLKHPQNQRLFKVATRIA